MADETEKKIKRELAKQGLRPAKTDEAGWYVTVTVEGQAIKLWATDLPPAK